MKCLNTRAKLIIQQLYEAMYHEPYMQTEGSHAKLNNNPAYMPVVVGEPLPIILNMPRSE